MRRSDSPKSLPPPCQDRRNSLNERPSGSGHLHRSILRKTGQNPRNVSSTRTRFKKCQTPTVSESHDCRRTCGDGTMPLSTGCAGQGALAGYLFVCARSGKGWVVTCDAAPGESRPRPIRSRRETPAPTRLASGCWLQPSDPTPDASENAPLPAPISSGCRPRWNSTNRFTQST